jgi:hypothetical protein
VQGRTLHRLLLAGRARYRRVGTVMLCQRRFAVRFIAGSPSWIHRDARRRSLGTASACKISQGVTSAIHVGVQSLLRQSLPPQKSEGPQSSALPSRGSACTRTSMILGCSAGHLVQNAKNLGFGVHLGKFPRHLGGSQTIPPLIHHGADCLAKSR